MSSQIVPRRTGVIVKRSNKRAPRRMEQKVFRMIYEMACEMVRAEQSVPFIAWMKEIIYPVIYTRLPRIERRYRIDPLNNRRYEITDRNTLKLIDGLDECMSIQCQMEERMVSFEEDYYERRICYYLSEMEMRKELKRLSTTFYKKLNAIVNQK